MAKRNKYAPPEECKQSVIFARVSSREQENGVSIDAQLNTIKDYSDKAGFINIEKYKVTESSTDGERKRFYEMLNFVKIQKNKTAIIVHCVDRIQRGYKECVEIEQLLKEDKIEVHFYKEGFFLHKESSSSDFMRYDMGVLSAKMYIGSMRDNVKRSLNYNWSIGKWQGYAPIGYVNKPKANLEFDPERASIVKILFEEYASTNHSLESLVDLAKELGLIARERENKKDINASISRSGIYHMLQNPFYYGIMRVKGQLIPHIYPKLIDKSLFDKVQKKLSGGKFKRIKTSLSDDFVFSGVVRCSTCGCVITPEQHTKKSGKQYIYLKCSHRKGNCKQIIVNENILFEQLDNEIFNNIKVSATMLDLLKKNVRKYLKDESIVNSSVKRNITNQLNGLKAKEERLFDFFLEGNINKTTYETKKAEIEVERNELQKTSEKYADINDELKEVVECIMDIVGNAPIVMKGSNAPQKRELLNLLFDDCFLDGKKLIYTLKKPFDKLIQSPKSLEWLKMQAEDIKSFDVLAGEVKVFNCL